MLQLLVTMVLLATVRPVLLLLPLFAIPAMIGGRWAQAHVDAAKARTAETARMSRHLLQLLTQAGPAKEIRVFGLGDELRRRQREAWDASTEELSRAELRAAGRALGRPARVRDRLRRRARRSSCRRRSAARSRSARVLFTAILASQITIQTSTIVLLTNQMQSMMRAVDGLELAARRRRAPGARRASPTCPCRPRSGTGSRSRTSRSRIRARSRPILEHVDLRLPAGAVVALVGENGAGKTTLVKLIGRFYEPSARHDHARRRGHPPLRARRRGASSLTAGFQDFARLEVLARETVGVGDLPNLDGDAGRRGRARAGARRATSSRRCPTGLETPLGRTWANGSELSGGQWQKLALGRTMMRERPLILLLDEPTAALDAHAEHVLFERYAATAREAARDDRRDHAARLAPLLDRAHGRPDPRPRRTARSSRAARTRS